jgi:hypothetical protein
MNIKILKLDNDTKVCELDVPKKKYKKVKGTCPKHEEQPPLAGHKRLNTTSLKYYMPADQMSIHFRVFLRSPYHMASNIETPQSPNKYQYNLKSKLT